MPEFDSDAVDPTLRLLYQSGVGISPSGIAANLDDRMDGPPGRPCSTPSANSRTPGSSAA